MDLVLLLTLASFLHKRNHIRDCAPSLPNFTTWIQAEYIPLLSKCLNIAQYSCNYQLVN